MRAGTRRAVRPEAYERFKRRYRGTLALSVLTAVAAHAALFQLFPSLGVRTLGAAGGDVAAVNLPPETRVPPPPEAIARPATPRVGGVELDEEITIAPTTFEENPVERLGPPPSATAGGEGDRPRFIPYDVAPRLLNRDEVVAALARYYPRELREAGISGRIVLWIYIDERGAVVRSQVQESSGHASLDRAAARVAAEMRFSPAKNRDLVTAVWLAQAINFDVVSDGS